MKPLSPRHRLQLLAVGYLIYVLAGPGILLSAGSPLGALGLVFWALAASRPGPWKKRIEWLAGACALTAQTTWMGIVFWFALIWLFVGYGCWSVWGGWLMKRLSACLPLTLATPLAWIGFESLLTWTSPPIGLSWLRLGHYLNDWPGLAGSGRVWGVMGLGFLLATLAGSLAELIVSYREHGRLKLTRGSWIFCGLTAGLAVLFASVVRPPASKSGPRVLLVQPAFEQVRKQRAGEPDELFVDSLELTSLGLAELKRAGERAPNLVCWGETMFPYPEVVSEVADDLSNLRVDPWNLLGEMTARETQGFLDLLEFKEEQALLALYGGEQATRRFVKGVLDPETYFLSGREVLIARDGRVRRTNSVVLWGATGGQLGRAEKTHLAPGGETMVGLERLELVRDIIYSVAGYVPDMAPALEPVVLRLPRSSGGSWSFSATVCFDNAFTDVYAEPLRAGPLDFHLVISNEAWYEDAQELDQMVAFSRMHALCTARSLVRCANSGVSAAFGMGGEELARLVVDGEDRQVSGTLAVDVPVPASSRAAATPFVWLEPYLDPLAALLPVLLVFLRGRKRSLGGIGS